MPGPKDQKLTKAIGLRIRQVRSNINMSQQNLAHRCDVELSTINRIELGYASPSITLLYKIAQSLGVSAKDLLP